MDWFTYPISQTLKSDSWFYQTSKIWDRDKHILRKKQPKARVGVPMFSL